MTTVADVPDQEPKQESAIRRLRRAVAPGVDELTARDVEKSSEDDVSTSPEGEAIVAELDLPPDGTSVTSRLTGSNPFDPGRRGVRALAVVAVLAIAVAALFAWRARPQPTPVASSEPGPAGLVVPSPDTGNDQSDKRVVAGPTTSISGDVVVAITGKVRRPGLVRLPVGARVADAVQAAGGTLPGADIAFLNLARRVSDGELIMVGVTAPPAAVGAEVTGLLAGQSPGGPNPEPTVMINLNTATVANLDSLPGVGPVLAQRIVDYRERHGAFHTVGDLRQVDGIGAARYEQLRPLVTV